MASKKDFAASAGELASTLFDRLKKSAAERNKSSTPSSTTTNSAAAAVAHNSSTNNSATASLIANLAHNLITPTNTHNSSNGASGSSSTNMTFAKLLNDQSVKNASLVIYDDDNLDDDDFDDSKLPKKPDTPSTSTTVPASKSELNMTQLKASLNKYLIKIIIE